MRCSLGAFPLCTGIFVPLNKADASSWSWWVNWFNFWGGVGFCMSGFWEYWYGEISLKIYRIQVQFCFCEHLALYAHHTGIAHVALLAVAADWHADKPVDKHAECDWIWPRGLHVHRRCSKLDSMFLMLVQRRLHGQQRSCQLPAYLFRVCRC
jgi:hypothetical protein